MNIDLSMWHCQVLFVIGSIELDKLAQKSGIHYALLREMASNENWRQKQVMYGKFTTKMRKSIENLESIFGDFVGDEEKLGFVNFVLEKAKTKRSRKLTRTVAGSGDDISVKEFIQQQESILGEYGMTPEQSKEFINNLKSKIGVTASRRSDTKYDKQQDALLSDIDNGRQTGEIKELSISEKLDTFNAGYRLLAASQNQGVMEVNKVAWDTLRHYYHQLKLLEYYEENGMDEEADKLLGRQRNRAYLGNIIFRLAPMVFEVSGLKGAVLKENAIAKFHSLGMTVIDNAVFQGLINPAN
jgi:hypothetical protein